MIDFTRAFDLAWERMMVILFRPFDFGKWCAIGFSAFLAGFLAGGNGVNGSYNNIDNLKNLNGGGSTSPSFSFHQFNSSISNAFSGLQLGLIIFISLSVFVVIIAFLFLFYWLGARGQFMFLDNVVRNRGAIAWPWSHYARQGNSLFGFYLLFMVISLALLLPILIVGILMGIPLYQHHRWPQGGEIAVFALLGLLYLCVAIALSFVLFLFRELGVPLMFRNGLMARAAFMESMSLLRQHTASVVIFVLLRFAISIAVAIVSVIACCFTCCLAAVPYIGTVILLPLLVYVRCFSLDCLAQFGPQYDVWTVDVPPFDPSPPGFSPPPRLG